MSEADATYEQLRMARRREATEERRRARQAARVDIAAAVRQRLAAARDDGAQFDDAWVAVVPYALALERDRNVRCDWREALNGTVDSWRAAYNDEDRDDAIRVLMESAA